MGQMEHTTHPYSCSTVPSDPILRMIIGTRGHRPRVWVWCLSQRLRIRFCGVLQNFIAHIRMFLRTYGINVPAALNISPAS